MMTPTIAALLREKEHYLRRNLPERVAAVDAELARLGYNPPEAAVPERLPETATPPRPEPRRSRPHAE